MKLMNLEEQIKLLNYVTHLETEVDRQAETIKWLKTEIDYLKETNQIMYDETQRTKELLRKKLV